MAIGGGMIADDRVRIEMDKGALIATAPRALRGMIEARGIGLLAAQPVDRAIIRLIADLGKQESDRLPPRRTMDIVGCATDLIYNSSHRGFAAAIRQYLIGGRLE